jgi:hypothetical protein
MLLGFKRQFAPFVKEGSKTHTIRGTRKIMPRVGETCHCFVDPRQKTMRLLGRWPCVKVQGILIFEDRLLKRVFIDGEELTQDEKLALAWRDGFRNFGEKMAFAEMMMFWTGRLPFEGHLIHWRHE